MVDVSAGKKGGGIDIIVEGMRYSILINSRRGGNRASLVSKTTNPLNKVLVMIAAADPHIKP